MHLALLQLGALRLVDIPTLLINWFYDKDVLSPKCPDLSLILLFHKKSVPITNTDKLIAPTDGHSNPHS